MSLATRGWMPRARASGRTTACADATQKHPKTETVRLAPRQAPGMTLSSQGKLVKDAVSEVCSAHERSRTQIQRRHAGSGRACG